VSAQLTLDALPEWRTRDGIWPIEAHQRGWVRLPWDIASGDKAGDILPAYVCCRCGGVELGQFPLENNHGCCRHWLGRHGTCSRLSAVQRHRELGLDHGRRWPLDEAWLPERPP